VHDTGAGRASSTVADLAPGCYELQVAGGITAEDAVVSPFVVLDPSG